MPASRWVWLLEEGEPPKAAAASAAARLLPWAEGHTSMASGLCTCRMYSCAKRNRATACTSTESASDPPAKHMLC